MQNKLVEIITLSAIILLSFGCSHGSLSSLPSPSPTAVDKNTDTKTVSDSLLSKKLLDLRSTMMKNGTILFTPLPYKKSTSTDLSSEPMDKLYLPKASRMLSSEQAKINACMDGLLTRAINDGILNTWREKNKAEPGDLRKLIPTVVKEVKRRDNQDTDNRPPTVYYNTCLTRAHQILGLPEIKE